jgi:hypothetical protein
MKARDKDSAPILPPDLVNLRALAPQTQPKHAIDDQAERGGGRHARTLKRNVESGDY